jgi:hypothetical protein
MKTRTILNPKKIDYLMYHLVDGFEVTRRGLKQTLMQGAITLDEYHDLVERNQDRLIARIKDFRIANKLLSILFACIFSYMQVNGDDLDMRRSSRARGRRRNESNQILNQKS